MNDPRNDIQPELIEVFELGLAAPEGAIIVRGEEESDFEMARR